MSHNFADIWRRWLKWPVVALGSLLGLTLAVVVGTAALIDAGYLHEPVRKLLVAKARREIELQGPVQARLLSWHPSLLAEQIVIHNPPWMPAGILAEIGKAQVQFEMPTLREPLRFRQLEIESATFNLLRDESGKANWRARDGRMSAKGPPLMGSLKLLDAQVHLRDARRHLTFDGKLSAAGAGADSLRIDATGELNTRSVVFAIVADPLASARRDKPYAFRFEEHSSGASLVGHGALAKPFDMRRLHSTLEAHGEDLKDAYYLIGLNFPDTGPFHVTAELQRKELKFAFTDLQGTSGKSDIAGTVHVDSTAERTQLVADLKSVMLRRADLGRKAAKRAPLRDKSQPVFSDMPLKLAALRRTDSTYNYRADSVDLGQLKLGTLEARVKVDHGVLTATPVSVQFVDGRATGKLTIDGSKEVIAVRAALDLDGLQLSQFGKDREQPPVNGLLRARLELAGKGRSAHELAASTNGTIRAILPHGEIRSSLAEAGGLDLRALGLKLSGKKTMVPLRCGVVAFDVQDGKLDSKVFVIDTEPVLITGEGTLDLDSEVLDLEFRGHPKHLRLRLRSSVVARGTLSQPDVGLKSNGSIAQTGVGVALGVLLTPLAAVAAFIDPGRAGDADCAALIGKAN